MAEERADDDGAEDVRAAIRQLGGNVPEVAPAYDEPPAEPEAALDEVSRIAKKATDLIESTEPKEHRKRDSGGRFARKETAESKAAAEPRAPDSETQRIAGRINEEIERGKPKVDANGVPLVLNKQEKAALEQLPPEIRKVAYDAIVRRETETEAGVQKLREQFGEGAVELNKLLAPRRETFRKLGFDRDDKAIAHLLSFGDAYERDPAALAIHVLRHMPPQAQHQVRQALGLQSAQQPQLTDQQLAEYFNLREAHQEVARFSADPNYAGLRHPEIREAMSALLNAGQARGLHDAHDRAVLHLVQHGRPLPDEVVGPAVARHEIAQFASNPAHEFFEILKPMMKQLLESGKARTLDQAYTAAMNAHPRLRAISPAAVKLEEKRRAANASLTGAPHGTPVPRSRAKPGTFQDAVEDVRAAIHQLS